MQKSSKHCCKKTFIPLQLSYAKTIHTFQGSNAGITEEGQPQNPIKRIICDPGKKEFELRNPGLFYTTFSRATTIGDSNDFLSSAIYFDGPNMCPDRIMNMTKTEKGFE